MVTNRILKFMIMALAVIMVILSGCKDELHNIALTEQSEEFEYSYDVKSADASKMYYSDWNKTGFYEDGEYSYFDRAGFLKLINRNWKNSEYFPMYDCGIVDILFDAKIPIIKIRLENEQVAFY